MKYLIFILVVYWLLSRMRSKGEQTMPLPQREPRELDYRSEDDDTPLRGPWDLPVDREEDDVPLSGPWSHPAPSGAGETGTDADEFDPPKELEDEPAAAATPAPLPHGDGDGERQKIRKPPVPLSPQEGLAECPVSPYWVADTKGKGQLDVALGTVGKRTSGSEGKGRSAGRGNSFASALCHRHNLAASIILGEVLATRGGRRKL